MKRVVIESPLRGDYELNRRYALACMRDSLRRGEAPFASHLLYDQSSFLDDRNDDDRKLGMLAGFAWAEAAEIRVFYTDLGISEGMLAGLDDARKKGTPIEFRQIGGTWK